MKQSIKYLSILIFIISFYLMFNLFNYRYFYYNNNFIENESITLFLNTSLNDDKDLIFHLSQFEHLIKDVYIDYNEEIKMDIFLKSMPSSRFNEITKVVKNPNFNDMFDSILKQTIENFNYDKINENIFEINNFYKIKEISSILYKFFQNTEINKSIGYDLFKIALQDDLKIKQIDRGGKKVRIIPHNEFTSFRDKKKYYEDLFEVIDYMSLNICNVDSITINNHFIYNDFKKQKSKFKSTFQLNYEKCIIAYSNSLDSLNKTKNELEDLSGPFIIESIADFLVDDKENANRHKILKKFNNYILNYKNITDIDYERKRLENILNIIESKFSDYKYHLNERDIEHSERILLNSLLDKSIMNVKQLVLFLNNDSNNFKFNYLVNNYYRHSSKSLIRMSNNDIINLEYLNTNINKEFYNSQKKSYVVKLCGFNSNHYKNINQLFENKTSVYKDYFYYKKLSIFILLMLFVFIILIKKYVI